MHPDSPILKLILRRVERRLSDGSTLALMRGIALTLAVISAIGVIPAIMTGPETLLTRLGGALAAGGLAAYWIVGYRRRAFPLAGEPLEVIALYVVLNAAPGHPFIPLCGLLFRCLYGTLPLAFVRWAAWSAALIVAGLDGHAADLESNVSRALGMMIVPFVLPGLRFAFSRLEASEQRLGSLIEHSTDVVTVLGEDLRVAWQAKSIRGVLGYEASDWLGTRFEDHVHPDDRPKLEQFVHRARNHPGYASMLELRLPDADGLVRWFEIAASNRLHDENVRGYVLNIRDATDRRRLEDERRKHVLVQQREATQRVEIERLHERMDAEREKRQLQERLQHAQRLESIGSLAGGVAHDFNNLLAIILNYVAFVRDELPENGQGRLDLDEIGRAAERGARLTEQLLAFGQRKIGDTEVLDVDKVIAGMHSMLKRSLGSCTELRYTPRPDLWRIEADPSDVEQIVLNLVVNARDATPDEGSIVLNAENATITQPQANELDVEPGRYLLVTVRDNGCGIDADTLAHVCEPFFTTKPPGEGSGLGLATVYGIARQTGGTVSISSQVGAGTQVDVYLPATDATIRTRQNGDTHPPTLANTGRILLVEDEPAVRDVVSRILDRAGFDVHVSENGEKALQRLRHDPHYDLLLTDVIMPGMWGDVLATHAKELHPDLPILFMSGYSERFLRRGRATAPGPVLTKPFREDALLTQVATLVSERRHGSANRAQPAGGPAEFIVESHGALTRVNGIATED
jgi:PAS domain S-box-containing protein